MSEVITYSFFILPPLLGAWIFFRAIYNYYTDKSKEHKIFLISSLFAYTFSFIYSFRIVKPHFSLLSLLQDITFLFSASFFIYFFTSGICSMFSRAHFHVKPRRRRLTASTLAAALAAGLFFVSFSSCGCAEGGSSISRNTSGAIRTIN